jgi:aryl-alcohol dehydrogenase-like predicted oxidoreductase
MPAHILAAVGRVAERHHASANQILLAWLLQKSPVMVPIPGTASKAHFEENMRSATIALSPAEMAELAGLGG